IMSGNTSATANNLTPGWHRVQITDANSCIINDSIFVSDCPQPKDSLNLEGSQVICPGDSLLLKLTDYKRTGPGAINTYNYQWFFNNTPITGKTDTFLFARTVGSYVLQVEDSVGCKIKSIPVLISHQPYPPMPTVQDTNYCQFMPAVALNATVTNASYGLRWYDDPITGAGSLTAPIPTTDTLGTQYYYVSQYNLLTNCEGSRARVRVFINGYPSATVVSALNVANDTASTGVIRQSVTGGAEPYTYTWTKDSNPFAKTTKDITLIPKGSYVGIVTDKKGCKDTITQLIEYRINDIDAVDDDFTNKLLTSAGGLAGNIYLNDSLNHFKVDSSDIQPSIINNGGIGGLIIDSQGNVIVPPGTLPGSYTVTYSICENLNLINCDNATILI
ncbi:MAG: hypothetical protein ACK469_09300, partial [Bacteroidota bacterium]